MTNFNISIRMMGVRVQRTDPSKRENISKFIEIIYGANLNTGITFVNTSVFINVSGKKQLQGEQSSVQENYKPGIRG